MAAAPQSLISQKGFTTNTNIDGLPGELRVHAVSEIVVSWAGTPSSSTKDRSGAENHEIRDPGACIFNPVTISSHGNASETKAVWDCFDKCGKGNPLRGAFTIMVVNPKDAFNEILEITLHDCTLQSYSPFGSLNVSDPTTMNIEFTLIPDRIEFKKA